jgi:hypothetical protein
MMLLPELSCCVHGSQECPDRTFVNLADQELYATLFSVIPIDSSRFCFFHGSCCETDGLKSLKLPGFASELLGRCDVSLKRGESVVIACSTTVLIGGDVDPRSIVVKLAGVSEDPQLQQDIACLPLAFIASPLPRGTSHIADKSNNVVAMRSVADTGSQKNTDQYPTLLSQMRTVAEADFKATASPPLSPTKKAAARRRARARRREAQAAEAAMPELCPDAEESAEEVELTEAMSRQAMHLLSLSTEHMPEVIPVARTFVNFIVADGWSQKPCPKLGRRMSWPC